MEEKNMKKRIIALVTVVVFAAVLLAGCEPSGSYADTLNTLDAGNKLQQNQPTPTDIDFSLQRYNLIRRAYYLNGKIEESRNVICEVEKPLGYIYLFLDGVGCIARDTVDGQVTPLTTYLTPDSEFYTTGSSSRTADWIPDIDGTYGENNDGIFYFTVDGSYKEWNGIYFYSSEYYEIADPMLSIVLDGEEAN